MARNNSIIRIPDWVKDVLIFILGLGAFIFILVNRVPFPLRPLAVQVRYGLTLLVPIAFMIFLLIFSIKGSWGKLACFVSILSLFALGLSGLWASGSTEPQVIGGLLPVTDSGENYYNALRFLNGSLFSDFASRRPLFSAFVTSLLWVAGKNLQILLALLVLLTACCAYFAVRTMGNKFGPIAATLFLLLLFLFYRRFSGLVMSENLGLPLGLLSFSLLVKGTIEKKPVLAYFSLFLLSFALNVRAGPFFVLPCLVLAVGLYFKADGGVWRNLLLSSAAVVAGFLLNWLVFKTLGSPTGALFSNFSYTLYGLAQGGTGWSKVVFDHPEILSLNETEIAQRILGFTFQAVRANPGNFVLGCLRQYLGFINFIKSNVSVFSFAAGENITVYYLTQVLLYLLSLIGLWELIRKRKQSFYFITLFALLGLLLSIPFITTDASNMRAYAAAIPFVLIIPTLGLKVVLERIPKLASLNPFPVPAESGPIGFSFFFILLSLLPIGMHGFLKPVVPVALEQNACPSDQTRVLVDIRPGTYIKIFPESDIFLDWVPNLHESRFKTEYVSYSLDAMRAEIKKLPSRSEIISTINLLDGKEMFLVITAQTIFDRPGLYSICGNWSHFPSQEYVSQYFYSKTFYNGNQ
jgi:hypothetical protein